MPVRGQKISTADTLSPAAQHYIRAIYDLQDAHGAGETDPSRDGRITTSQLANCMGLRAASVTAMLQKLAAANPPLIEYAKHRGAWLTADGLQAALALVRRHRLLEAYLHERLNYRWDEVHDEAQRLEPVVSYAFSERLADALGQPTHDPHGHAIPTVDLNVPPTETVTATSLRPGDRAEVVQVADDDPDCLRFLASAGLRPGVRFSVVRQASATEPLQLRLDEHKQTVDLSAEQAAQLDFSLTATANNPDLAYYTQTTKD